MLSATANCGQYSTFVNERRKNNLNVDLAGGGGGGQAYIYIYIHYMCVYMHTRIYGEWLWPIPQDLRLKPYIS